MDFIVWLLAITLMQFYNENEQAGQKETQNVKFEEKQNNRTRLIPRYEKLKEKFDVTWNKGSVALRTRPHLTKLQTFKKVMSKDSSTPKTNERLINKGKQEHKAYSGVIH